MTSDLSIGRERGETGSTAPGSWSSAGTWGEEPAGRAVNSLGKGEPGRGGCPGPRSLPPRACQILLLLLVGQVPGRLGLGEEFVEVLAGPGLDARPARQWRPPGECRFTPRGGTAPRPSS